MLSGFKNIIFQLDIDGIKKAKNEKVDIAEILESFKDTDVEDKSKDLFAKLIAVIAAELKDIVSNYPEPKAIAILNSIEKAVANDIRLTLALIQIIQDAYSKIILEPDLDLEVLKKEIEANKEIMKGAKELTYDAYIFGPSPAENERAQKLAKLLKDPKFDPVKSSSILDSYNDCRRINKTSTFAVQIQADPIEKKIYDALSILKIGEFSNIIDLSNLVGEKIKIIVRLLSSSDMQISSKTGIEISMRSTIDKKANEKAAELIEKYVIDSRNLQNSEKVSSVVAKTPVKKS